MGCVLRIKEEISPALSSWRRVKGLGIDQWYPVVYLRPQEPERRISPPTYEGVPNILRVVSFEQAEKRLALKLQNSWLGQLEADAAASRSS